MGLLVDGVVEDVVEVRCLGVGMMAGRMIGGMRCGFWMRVGMVGVVVLGMVWSVVAIR